MINDIRTKVLLDMVSRPTVQQSTVPKRRYKTRRLKHQRLPYRQRISPFKQMVTKLLQTIKNQQELLQSLPSELREVVEQIINDLQPQGELLPNMTTLVKTPKLVTQELINLAQQLKPEQLTPEKDLPHSAPRITKRNSYTKSPHRTSTSKCHKTKSSVNKDRANSVSSANGYQSTCPRTGFSNSASSTIPRGPYTKRSHNKDPSKCHRQLRFPGRRSSVTALSANRSARFNSASPKRDAAW